MYNPRWPHTFVIVPEYLDANGLPVTDSNGDPCEPTPPVNDTLDENGLPVTDENGNSVQVSLPEGPDETTVETTEAEPTHPTVKVALYDGKWNPRYDATGAFLYEELSEIPWGYRTATGGIKESGDVIVADYKVSTPMLLSDIPTGTLVLMTDYAHTFLAKVIKVTTYNWGTNIWVDNVKN